MTRGPWKSSVSVTAITAERCVPSAWYRAGQLISTLQTLGVDVHWRPARVQKYPPRRQWLRPLWLPAAVASRVVPTVASWRTDVTWLVREMVSTLVTLEPITLRPRVLDIDDAVWLHPRGAFASKLAAMSEIVVAGNSFIADWFAQHAPEVVVVPTGVDIDLFSPRRSSELPEHDPLVIGWIGTAFNLKYLKLIEEPLSAILAKHPECILRVVCDSRPELPLIPARQLEFVRWSRAHEADLIRSMDIGVMPLEDSDWCRGKCSYKMLQYMASGVAVAVSPVGMNLEVLRLGNPGLAPESGRAWYEALDYLIENRAERGRFAAEGRRIVVEKFSLDIVAARLAAVFRQVAR